jgi:hypothetical protein
MKNWGSTLRLAAAGAVATLALAAPSARAVAIFGIDDNPGQHLLTFDSASPTTLASSVAVTGLQANEKLIGIDFRVSASGINQGALYGVGSFGRIYTLNSNTGAATFVAALNDGVSPVILNGTEFGFGFNPQADRLRIVSDLDQNFRVDVDTGLTSVDAPLNPSNPNVTDISYDRNDQNPGTATTLFGIDTFSNQLVRIGGVDGVPSPNLGTVTPVGSLVNIDPTSVGGFDIEGGTGTAYLASRNAAGGGSMLSTVNLTTGQTALIGFIGNPEDGLVVKGIAVLPAPGVPEPTAALALLGLGLGGLIARRRVK